MFINRNVRTFIGILLLFYGGVSVLCLSAASIPQLDAQIEANWGYVWLFGPPAALLFRFELGYMIIYSVGSILFFSLLVAAVMVKSWTAKAWLAFFVPIVWTLIGIYVMATSA